MSYLYETPPEVSELDPEFEFCLQERDKILYEIRRQLKAAGVGYRFKHDPPRGGAGLLLLDPIPVNLLFDLQRVGFLQATPSIYYRDLQTPSGSSLIRIIVRLEQNDTRLPSAGNLLLISTHTLS